LLVGTVLLVLAVLWIVFRTDLLLEDALIVRLDTRLDHILSRDAKLEKVADGLKLTEGPVWDKASGALLFSDMAANAIFRWRAGEPLHVFLQFSGYTGSEPFRGPLPGSNGLAFDPAGRLVLCEHGNRRITRLEPDGSRTVLVDRFRGRRLNSPNDLVFNSKGDLYFTDPPYGLPGFFDDPGRELDFSGVYRLSADGQLTLLTDALKGPNGLAFSPSEKTLYVSDTAASEPGWFAFDVNDDGTLANRRGFLTTPAWARTSPGPRDGLKVDRFGNIFAAGRGGIHIFAADGTHLGSIKVQASNLAWGEDGSVLFLTSSTTVYRIRTQTIGNRF
jgi:gluconolactonase